MLDPVESKPDCLLSEASSVPVLADVVGVIESFEYDEELVHSHLVNKQYSTVKVILMALAIICSIAIANDVATFIIILNVPFFTITVCFNPVLRRFISRRPPPQTAVTREGILHIRADAASAQQSTPDEVVLVPFGSVKSVDVISNSYCISVVKIATLATSVSKLSEMSGLSQLPWPSKSGDVNVSSRPRRAGTFLFIRGLRDPYQFRRVILSLKSEIEEKATQCSTAVAGEDEGVLTLDEYASVV